MQPSQLPTQRKSLIGQAHYLRHQLKKLMRGINVITSQFNKNICIATLQIIFDSINMQLNSMVDK